jgi:hydrogenase-4 membrane subunit HyfE
MTDQVLTKCFKVVIVLGVLLAMGFLVAALFTFLQQGDWPARYVATATFILGVLFIAARRRARRR